MSLRKLKIKLTNVPQVRLGKIGEYFFDNSVIKINKGNRDNKQSLAFFSNNFTPIDWNFLKSLPKGHLLEVMIKENSDKNSFSDRWIVKKLVNKNSKIINENLQLLKNDPKLVIIDIETSKKGEIIEIAYLVIENNQITKKINHLVKPQALVNNLFNNISLIELAEAKKLSEVIKLITPDLIDGILVGHNIINFDYHKINKAWQEVWGRSFPHKKVIDTFILYKYLFNDHICHSRSEKGKHTGCYGLENIIRQLTNRPYYREKHRAEDDVQDNLLVWKVIFSKIKNLN